MYYLHVYLKAVLCVPVEIKFTFIGFIQLFRANIHFSSLYSLNCIEVYPWLLTDQTTATLGVVALYFSIVSLYFSVYRLGSADVI